MPFPPKPYQASQQELAAGLDTYVAGVFSDLTSSFLLMPKGNLFIEYGRFVEAYETLKAATSAFRDFAEERVWGAIQMDSLCFLVVRTILGMTPPEWAELARQEGHTDITTGVARQLDGRVREERAYFARTRGADSLRRARAMVVVACQYIVAEVPAAGEDTVHRLNKVDTAEGLLSLARAGDLGIPYAVLLYERYLGRPFASHRDSVSELIGDAMENAIESVLAEARITFRKTRRAERIPGFDQAPDFIVPDELAPSVVIEAKLAGDDGTARDKVARIIRLTALSEERVQSGRPGFQVVACIDGRGFGVRREDMRQLLAKTGGKVFTLANLEDLIVNTDLQKFLPLP